MKLNRIRTKLALLLLAIGLVPAALVYGAFVFEEGDLKADVLTGYENLAISIGDTIDRNLFERYRDVQAFGLNGEAHKPENWHNPGEANPLVRAINGYMTNYGLYRIMLLVGPQGDVLAVNTVDGKGKPVETAPSIAVRCS